MDQQATPQHAFGSHVERRVATDAERRQIVVDEYVAVSNHVERQVRLQIRDLELDALRIHEAVGVHACEIRSLRQ
jgi:hypothetical protein